MPNVFISYAREDSDFAEVLQARLTKDGYTTWMDLDMIRAGDSWRDKIDQAIKDSVALIVVMTPEAEASEYVSYEWAFALGAGIRVIPVKLKATDFHPRLEVLQHFDFSQREARPWAKLAAELDKAAKARTEHSVQVPADAPPVVKQAVAALDDLDTSTAKHAVSRLAQMDHPAAEAALVAALQHPVPDVRCQAAMELAHRGDPRALPGLIELQRRWRLRFEFVRLAAKFGPAALPTLIEALRDKDTEVREYVVRALGEIRDATAVPHLIQAFQDQRPEVRFAAVGALRLFDTPEALAAVEQWERER